MKIIKTIIQIAVLYGIYFLGESIQSLLQIPIPGSIIGLLLLFTALAFHIVPVEWIEDGARLILTYLPLFFIPATVGVINYPDFLSWTGLLLVIIVIISTLATMAAAGWVSQFFQLRQSRKEAK
ncbi:putative integral membrane protein YxzK [Halobacillus andaensis]|uniref:Integral membrane protein YxzK n=1 Tax=Halobacillus andaensis TaxID=1176239 RepID=A0A917B2C0_HALAA|nr:CidA/LrgA family holin-like protein [Halobacillus andaensis]MBP2004805.1 holin-like protein [Halobacillus andaensis]GGF18748.1 putative integral membrane protein YxzK [Halobacillus andaensis]